MRARRSSRSASGTSIRNGRNVVLSTVSLALTAIGDLLGVGGGVMTREAAARHPENAYARHRSLYVGISAAPDALSLVHVGVGLADLLSRIYACTRARPLDDGIGRYWLIELDRAPCWSRLTLAGVGGCRPSVCGGGGCQRCGSRRRCVP